MDYLDQVRVLHYIFMGIRTNPELHRVLSTCLVSYDE